VLQSKQTYVHKVINKITMFTILRSLLFIPHTKLVISR